VGSDALAPEVVNIIDSSSENKVFGPIQTANGFEIIKVDDRRFDLPNPADISKAEEQAYNRWLSSRAESNFVASLGDVWRDAIPNDPLPRQVAPYLAEEYLGLPTLTPTPSN
jgi:hypothetical protein